MQVLVQLPSQPQVQTVQQTQYTMSISPLVAYIAGGNRMQSYSAALQLDGVTLDPDVVPAQQQAGITTSWSCINFNTNSGCKNILLQPISLNNSNTQTFPAQV